MRWALALALPILAACASPRASDGCPREESPTVARASMRDVTGTYSSALWLLCFASLELREGGEYVESEGNCTARPNVARGTWEVAGREIRLHPSSKDPSRGGFDRSYVVVEDPDAGIALVEPGAFDPFGPFGPNHVTTKNWLRRDDPDEYWSRVGSTAP